GSDRPAPATSVSSTWASKLSLSASTAAMPPWAQPLEPSPVVRLVSTQTRWVGARCSAADRPARPLPTISTSKSRAMAWFMLFLWWLASRRLVGQPHVDGRVGFGLRHLDQRFLGEFERG